MQLFMRKLRAARTAAAVSAQAIWRGYRIRQQWAVIKNSATLVQACIRMSIQRKQFVVARKSAVVIQARWKAVIVFKKFRASVNDIRLLQSVIRMFLADLEIWRRRIAVRQIQGAARQCLARRLMEDRRQQRVLREAASVILQRYWRGFCTVTKYQLVRQDAILIQSAIRKYRAQLVSDDRRKVVLCLQKAARCWLARKRLRTLAAQKIAKEWCELKSATRIQSFYRGWLIRREILHLNYCALSIQRIFRGHIKRIDCYLEMLDILLVQSTARRWLANQFVLRRQEAILRLQCWARVCLARAERSSMVLKHLSATKIQKTWRCYTVHVEYMLYILAAIDIQACVRRFLAAAAYETKFTTIIRIQAFARFALHKMRAEREKQCIVSLQSVVRMFLCCRAFHRQMAMKRSAIRLQASFRMLSCRSRFLLDKVAATIIQRYTRGFVSRLQLETEHFAAAEIQRIWRGFVACEYLAWNILSAMKIQSVWRMILAQQRVRDQRLELIAAKCIRQRSALTIQRTFHEYLSRLRIFRAASVIQHAAQEYLSRIAFGKLKRGVLRAQAVIRGRLVRSKCSKKVRVRAARIEAANSHARANPRLRLGNRTRAALDILLKSKSLSEIMEAVTILEIATRLSEVCCASFVEAEATNILFVLIRTCNRSLPHIKLLHGVLLTMSNVAKYDYLLPSMATVTGVEVFLDLVQMFRDKDAVFCLVVALLERVVGSSEEAMVRRVSVIVHECLLERRRSSSLAFSFSLRQNSCSARQKRT